MRIQARRAPRACLDHCGTFSNRNVTIMGTGSTAALRSWYDNNGTGGRHVWSDTCGEGILGIPCNKGCPLPLAHVSGTLVPKQTGAPQHPGNHLAGASSLSAHPAQMLAKTAAAQLSAQPDQDDEAAVHGTTQCQLLLGVTIGSAATKMFAPRSARIPAQRTRAQLFNQKTL